MVEVQAKIGRGVGHGSGFQDARPGPVPTQGAGPDFQHHLRQFRTQIPTGFRDPARQRLARTGCAPAVDDTTEEAQSEATYQVVRHFQQGRHVRSPSEIETEQAKDEIRRQSQRKISLN